MLRADSSFIFGEDERDAFVELKRVLVKKAVLHLYRVNAETELHTDACKFGYGAILLQRGHDNALHPVYFASGKTTPAEENYTSYELEVLAIVRSLKNLEFIC